MTSGDSIKDLIILARHVQWQYKLENYTVESLKSITKVLNQARNELYDEITRRDMRLSPGREGQVLQELNDLTLGIQQILTQDIAEAAQIAGQASLREYGSILSFDGRLAETVGFSFVSLSSEQIQSMILDTPVGGRKLEDWVSRAFDREMIEKIKEEVSAGVFKGEGTSKLADRIRTGFNMLDHEAITLTRTYVASMNNRAAESVYKANSDIVKWEEWNATLEVSTKSGRGTCFQCAALDGQRWRLDEPHPRPLAHPRCRCFMVPVTASYRELGLDIDELKRAARPFTVRNGIPVDVGRSKTILKAGQFTGSAEEFIRKQGPLYMKNVVGPNRKALIDAGKIKFQDLVDKDGNIILLKDLPELGKPVRTFRRKKIKTDKNLEKNLLAAESAIYLRKTEKAFVFAPDGTEVFSKSGGKKSVSFSIAQAESMNGNILTHNHPTGSSFSKQDINLLIARDIQQIRAVGKDYVHTFSLKPNAPGHETALKLVQKEHEKAETIVLQDFNAKIGRGDITVDHANKNHAHQVWQRVSDRLHWVDYQRNKWKPLR